MRNLIIGTAAALALSAGAATAAQVSFSDADGLAPTELVGSLSVPKFDGTLGTLTSVEWSVNRIVDGIINITNNSGTTQSGSAASQVTFNLTNLSPGTWDLLFDDNETVSASTGPLSLTNGESTGDINVTGSLLSNGTLPGQIIGNLNSWVGPGNIGFDYETQTVLALAFGGGNVTATQQTQARIELDVVYNYEPNEPPNGEIPVPAALPLLATAIGALGIWRARRKA